MEQDWSIHDVARLSGTTSRALRHYDALGLLRPSRTGANGYRYYDARALVRLQRILLLRELGLGLATIGEVLAGGRDDLSALDELLTALHAERSRLDRRIASVTATVAARREGRPLMAERMFEGFDHTAHESEVTARWGARAYADGDAWWRAKSDTEKREWQDAQAALAADWTAAAEAGDDPAGEAAQALARRQADWLVGIPGTPPLSGAYLTGLGEMYVADERFARHYGGVGGATFVRDALAVYARGL